MKQHVSALAFLLALCCAVQCWTVARAVAPAADAMRFIKIAQAIGEHGLANIVQAESEHVLFPCLVCLSHKVLRAGLGDLRSLWVLSAQAAAAAALVLSIVPVYFLTARVGGLRAALPAGILYAVLPDVARLGADALSDSAHLLLAGLAMWSAAVGFSARRERRWRGAACLLLAGGAIGLALLARGEAVLLLPAVGLTVLFGKFHCTGSLRIGLSWRQTLGRLAAFALGLTFTLGPYLLAVRAVTPRTAWARIVGHGDGDAHSSQSALTGSPSQASGELPGWWLSSGKRMSFRAKERSVSIRFHGIPAALKELGQELASAFGYWIGGLAMLGLWRRGKRRLRPIDVFALVLFLTVSAAVFYVACRTGYLASRHLLILTPLGLGWSALGARQIAAWAGRARDRLAWRGVQLAMRPARLCWAVVILAAAACLPKTLLPLHASQKGYRLAAEWLAAASPPGALVLDTRGWTGLYSGRRTLTYAEAPSALADPALTYIVVAERELHTPSRRSQTLRELLHVAGRRPRSFHGRPSKPETVLVYRWRSDRFAARWGRDEPVRPPLY